MRQNIIDRAIAHFAPVHAAKRLHARAQIGVFDALAGGAMGTGTPGGASSAGGPFGRWMSWAMGRDAQADIMPTLTLDRAESRNLARYSPIAGGAININVDRVVGTGLALVATPMQAVLGWSDEQALGWKQRVQAEFSLWADDAGACDFYAQQTFYDLQALVLRSTLESGDAFTILPDVPRTQMQPYALRLQVLEADRVGNENGGMDSLEVSGGIRMNAAGRPVSAFVYDRHPGAQFLPGNGQMWAGTWYDFVGASGRRRLLPHLRKLRPGQMRGVPYLAPIIEILKQLQRYSEAEIKAAVVSALFTVFVKTPSGNLPPVFDGQAPAPTLNDDSITMGNGAVVGLAQGEEIQFADPSRPNPNFEAFIDACMTQIGMVLGPPAKVLLKKHDGSYTAARAAFLDAWVYFRGVRHWLAGSFCQPSYETWLAEAVAIGRIAAPGFFTDPLMRWAYTRADWRGDSMGSINPKDEVAAYSAAIDARLTTRERAEWELFGTDFDATLSRKASEEQRLKDAQILPVPKAGAAAAPAQQPAADDSQAA